MYDQPHRSAAFGEPPELLEGVSLMRRVHRGGRFVGQEHTIVPTIELRQGACHRDALLLTHGEGSDGSVREFREIHLVDRAIDGFSIRAQRVAPELDHPPDIEIERKGRSLRHEPDLRGPLPRGHREKIGRTERNGARVRTADPREDPDEGGLPRAVRAEDRGELPRFECARHALEDIRSLRIRE